MKIFYRVFIVLSFTLPLAGENLFAQTELLSEVDLFQIKRLQSFRNTGDRNSMSSQMLFLGANIFENDTSSGLIKYKSLQLDLYRIGMAYQFNTHIGQSTNDGAFLPNVGLQKKNKFESCSQMERVICKICSGVDLH